MAKNYMGVNLTGRSLMHYRTKGSRNGYSKDPNYRPTGQRAIGRLVNGRYVYDQGARNNWQQQANREAASSRARNKLMDDSSKAAYLPRRHGGDMYVNPSNLEIDTTRRPNKTPGANAMRQDPRYNLYDSMKIEEAKRTAAQKNAATNEPQSVARAESLIRQIKGNRARMAKQIDRENPNASRYARTYAKAMTGPKANIDAQFTKAYSRNVEAGGAMKNDPRYSSKSVYVSPNGYAHTSQEIAKEIGESKNRSYTKASPIGSRMDAARGSVNRSIRKAKREVANTASKAYNTASKYASAAASKAKSAASSASKAASSAVATGKKTVDDLLNKFKKKKK